MKSTSTGSSIARMRSAMKLMAPFKTPTSSGGFVGVVAGDLAAQFGHAVVDLLRRDDDLAEVALAPTCAVKSSRGGYPCLVSVVEPLFEDEALARRERRRPPLQLGRDDVARDDRDRPARLRRRSADARSPNSSTTQSCARSQRRSRARGHARSSRQSASPSASAASARRRKSSSHDAPRRSTSAWRARSGTTSRSATSHMQREQLVAHAVAPEREIVVRSRRRRASRFAACDERRAGRRGARVAGAWSGRPTIGESPSSPAPRSMLSSTVSARSSIVWPGERRPRAAPAGARRGRAPRSSRPGSTATSWTHAGDADALADARRRSARPRRSPDGRGGRRGARCTRARPRGRGARARASPRRPRPRGRRRCPAAGNVHARSSRAALDSRPRLRTAASRASVSGRPPALAAPRRPARDPRLRTAA